MVKKEMVKADILLRKGSDELDIVEFCVGGQCYGVSITQVREIIRGSTAIVAVSDAHPSIEGVVNLRGKIIPVVNLAAHLGIEASIDEKASRIIVLENRQRNAGFLVSRATRIHRVALSDVDPPSDLVQSRGQYVFGVTKLDDRILFLLDLEKIASDIRPGQTEESEPAVPSGAAPVGFDRATRKILVAEDSPFMRNLIVQHAKKAGYQVIAVDNGFEAWQILEGTTQLPDFTDISRYYHLVITDIEMPQMDGLHLIRSIREHPLLHKLPCIVFSALITEQMSQKCREVGADEQVSKPEINRLIYHMDQLVLK